MFQKQLNNIDFSGRIVAWDLLKLFAIFLVVYGHCMQHLLKVETVNNPLFLWISSFHMPLFMSLSGIFAYKSYRLPVKQYLLKRSRQVLLPCFSWSIITLVFLLILTDNQSFSLQSFVVNSLWFLKSVFVCGVLGLIAFKPQRHRIRWILVSLILSQFCLIWNVFIMYPCFLLGILIFNNLAWLVKYKWIVISLSGMIFFTLSLYISFRPDFWIFNKGIRAAFFSGELTLSNGIPLLIEVILKRYIQLFIGLCSSLFFILLFLVLFNRISNKFLSFLANQGQYTLSVYVMQTVILETLLAYFISFDSSFFVLFDLAIAPVVSIIVINICLYISKIILGRGGKVATFLLGVQP